MERKKNPDLSLITYPGKFFLFGWNFLLIQIEF